MDYREAAKIIDAARGWINIEKLLPLSYSVQQADGLTTVLHQMLPNEAVLSKAAAEVRKVMRRFDYFVEPDADQAIALAAIGAWLPPPMPVFICASDGTPGLQPGCEWAEPVLQKFFSDVEHRTANVKASHADIFERVGRRDDFKKKHPIRYFFFALWNPAEAMAPRTKW